MESTENRFETALSSLSALTPLQPQLTGASHLLKATQRLIAEKLTTLALTPRSHSPLDNIESLPSLTSIRTQLQKSNMDLGQTDTIIDNLLADLQQNLDTALRVDIAQYTTLLDTRQILATNAIGFRFEILDAVIRRVAEMLCEEAVGVNKALRSPGKEIAETPPREAPAKERGRAEKRRETSRLAEMVDVDSSQAVTVSSIIPSEDDSSDEDMSSPMRPRAESISLSDS